MKYVVTGATGFVGRNTVRKLLRLGYDVISITTSQNISIETLSYIDGSEILKINSLSEISKFFIEGNIILHCAWSNVQNIQDKSHYFHATDQIAFITKIAKFNPKKVIITGTCYEFGLRTGPVSVIDNTDPNTPYAQSKVFVHKAAEFIFQREPKIEFTWARLFFIFGEGQHEKSIYKQIMDAIGRKDDTFNMSNGDQLYDYMNIEEVAEKLCILATSEVPKIVHVCNGYPITLKSLMQNILKKKSSPLKLNLGFYPYRPNESLALWGAESFESQIK